MKKRECLSFGVSKQRGKGQKELAKDKLERAIFDVAYAKGSYEKEMEQTALLNEVKSRI